MKETEASIIKTIIEKRYSIGEFTSFEKLHRGYVNESYIIETLANGERHKFFLRKYRAGIKAEEIRFEHSIIAHLTEKKFTLAARVINARDGNTCIEYPEEKRAQVARYALYDFLSGDDCYTWVNPRCTNTHLKIAAVVLARYHDAVSDLIPAGRRREPVILDLLPMIARILNRRLRETGDNVFHTYLDEHRNLISRDIEETLNAMRTEAYQHLPKLAIHCDFHPGNLKFQGDEVAGLFDFDWSKLDVRAFDVALALFYFCTAWERDGCQDGEFLLRQAAVFLHAYQESLRESSEVGPLNAGEMDFLPTLIRASNLYVLYWAVMDFYAKEVDPQEYLGYLRHNVCLMRWLGDGENWKKLESMLVQVESRPNCLILPDHQIKSGNNSRNLFCRPDNQFGSATRPRTR